MVQYPSPGTQNIVFADEGKEMYKFIMHVQRAIVLLIIKPLFKEVLVAVALVAWCSPPILITNNHDHEDTGSNSVSSAYHYLSISK